MASARPSTVSRRLSVLSTCGSAKNHLGLKKSSDEVFPGGYVDRCFASNARINYSSCRCWDLNDRHTPHVSRCSKTSHITDYTAAKRHDNGVARTTISKHKILDRRLRFAMLGGLTWFKAKTHHFRFCV